MEEERDYSSPTYPNYLTSVLYSSSSVDYKSPSVTPTDEDFPTESAMVNSSSSSLDTTSEDVFLVSSTEFPPWMTGSDDNFTSSSSSTTPPTTPTTLALDCSSPLDYNYDPLTTVICIALFMFGVYFCIFGTSRHCKLKKTIDFIS